jgi:hypothetical protein
MSIDVRHGIHPHLEAEANAIIFGALRGVTSQAEKSDILTPWKEQDRRAREVLATSGTVDPALRRGMYHRVANFTQPHLNGREGHSRASRTGSTLTGDWPTYDQFDAS